MKTLIIQAKGGVGKTHLALLLAMKAERDKEKTIVLDVDNDTPFLEAVFKKKPKEEYLFYKPFNLITVKKNADKDRFDQLFELAEHAENLIADFGAGSSALFMRYLSETPQLIGLMKELDLKILFVIAGGNHFSSAEKFMAELSEIPGIDDISYIVANEAFGGTGNFDTITKAVQADITLPTVFSGDITESTATLWQKALSEGVSWNTLDQKITAPATRLRVKAYLEKLYDSIDSALKA